MNTQLFVPSRLRVGFCERGDTYTKKLAYVIYYDSKKVLRKEKSWQGWRDEKIEPEEYDNVPTEGFVLNKKVGGYKSDWNVRQTAVRVFDPRGFEFEITVPNLLFILECCNAMKGKGLEGKFVYAWEGADLVLLPEDSATYDQCVKFTTLQAQKVSSKSMIPGAIYQTKKEEKLIYIGRYDWYEPLCSTKYRTYRAICQGKGTVTKKYVFQRESDKAKLSFVTYSGLDSIGGVINERPVDDYAERLVTFQKSENASAVVRIEGLPMHPLPDAPKDYNSGGVAFIEREPGHFSKLERMQEYNYLRGQQLFSYKATKWAVRIEDGVLMVPELPKIMDRYDRPRDDDEWEIIPKAPIYKLRLHFENGEAFDYSGWSTLTRVTQKAGNNGGNTASTIDG